GGGGGGGGPRTGTRTGHCRGGEGVVNVPVDTTFLRGP
ncbi:hypothetical protein ABLO07_18535, partial [Mycobacterium tuberculosis]